LGGYMLTKLVVRRPLTAEEAAVSDQQCWLLLNSALTGVVATALVATW
jgi:hypothetical protein